MLARTLGQLIGGSPPNPEVALVARSWQDLEMAPQGDDFALIARSLSLPGERVCLTRNDSSTAAGYIIEVDDGVRHFEIVRGVFDGYVVEFDGDIPSRTFYVRDGVVVSEPL
jgi:hypothetical protein